MNLESYYQSDNDALLFSREQASRFAKQVAGDFNPIHDSDARRFCVPGDLLFAVLLQRQNLYRNMEIEFAGMVTDQSNVLTESAPGVIRFINSEGADFIIARHDDQRCGDSLFANQLARAYVTFSGMTFPELLVPLMREHNAMINPSRPMVMYRRMSLSLDVCGGDDISLAFTGANFDVKGKKGEISLYFDIKTGENVIGTGMKNMLVSGLRPFDETAINTIVDDYTTWKNQWRAENS